MNNNKVSNYFFLMEYLNNNDNRSLDSEIARFLFEHRNEIKDMSLSKIAEAGYFSKASVSRFFKNNGVEKFADYSTSNAKAMMWYDGFYRQVYEANKGKNTEEIRNSVVNEMLRAVNQVNEIPAQEIEKAAEMLKKSKKIIFIGSQLSLSQIYGLQALLVYDGCNAYAPQDYDGQKFLVENAGENDTIIVISTKARWYHSSPVESYKNRMFASKAEKILWTAVKKHDDEEKFSYVLHFGDSGNQFAYAQLMTLVPILMNTYVIKYCSNKVVL